MATAIRNNHYRITLNLMLKYDGSKYLESHDPTNFCYFVNYRWEEHICGEWMVRDTPAVFGGNLHDCIEYVLTHAKRRMQYFFVDILESNLHVYLDRPFSKKWAKIELTVVRYLLNEYDKIMTRLDEEKAATRLTIQKAVQQNTVSSAASA